MAKERKMLTRQELEEVRKGLKKVNKKRLIEQGGPTKAHLGHRRFKTKDDMVWYYYIPDFSNLVKDFFIDVMESIESTIGLEGKIGAEGYKLGNKALVVKFNKGLIVPIASKKIIEDKDYCMFLEKRYNELLAKVNQEIGYAEAKLNEGKAEEVDVEGLFGITAKFTSLNLDKFFPYEKLDEIVDKACSRFSKDDKIFYNNPQSILFSPPSGISCYMQTHLGLLEMAEAVMVNEKPDVQKFINNIGYVGTNDLIPAELENPETVEREIESYMKNYNNISAIYDEKERVKFERRQIRIRQSDLIRLIVKNSDDKEMAERLCKFATVVSECNERRRFAVTRAYRLFRKMVEYYNLDPMKDSIEDIKRMQKVN